MTGLEWNVRVSGLRNPDVVAKMAAVFDSYWESDDFAPYDAAEFATRSAGRRGRSTRAASPTEIHLRPFQERLLEQIAVARHQGHHRNLLVAATGTGKTVMAAVDYARLRHDLPEPACCSSLTARRSSSRAVRPSGTRCAMRASASCGSAGTARSCSSTFSRRSRASTRRPRATRPDHFDVVIVDEFHHAAAPSYEALLEHVEPVELLGLTATPERADGLDVLRYFDGRIAAELRLWDAIDQQYLAPFAYFGDP